jgi:hypothetical protein
MSVDHSSEGIKELMSSAKAAMKEKGLVHVLRSLVKEGSFRIGNSLALFYYKTFKSLYKFNFQGKKYGYLYIRYNRTWRNERAVEIPITWEVVKRFQGKNILEFGNVLSHYFPVSHEVVDKYEKAPGVINQDIVDFRTERRYDLIVGISTLEHVGWDEEHKDPEKTLRAVEVLRGLLSPAGMLMLTIPVGYNPHLDRYLDEGRMKFTRTYYLKRVSASNRWIEVEWKDIRGSKFHYPYHNANGRVIAVLENKAA